MLLRNIDPEIGLCNGARGIVMEATRRVLDIMLIAGKHAGRRVYVPRISLAPKIADLPFTLRRRQFPVKLAWAMTINKAQGQTLQMVGVFLPQPVFSHGQLYVALSRVGSADRIKVLALPESGQGHYKDEEGVEDGLYTANIVWPEALLGNPTPNLNSPSWNPPAALPACKAPGDAIGSLEIDEGSGLTSLQMKGSTCAPATIVQQESDTANMDAGEHNSLDGTFFFTPVSFADDGVTLDFPAGHAEPADLHRAWFPGYFEPQQQARCGMHAINNAIGYQFADAPLMSKALRAYLPHARFEGLPETAADHESPSGDYSIELLAFLFQWRHNIYFLDVNRPILPGTESLNRIYDQDVCGILVNKNQHHWVTFKLVDETIWFLDSQGEPEPYSFAQYSGYLAFYGPSYAIRSIA